VEPAEERHPAVIDHFFHSIAEDTGARGIGVILSGGGTDGTLGLKAISDRGGLTFAQEPRSASHDSMPRSAATTGVADHVLVPAEIAAELLLYVRHLDVLTEQRHAHDADSIIARLERELETTRSDLDRTLQDMEAANEELKSSNAELLSMNDELQSANEELETSKEEIRAGNDTLSVAIADLENLLRSTQIATVFLDDQLQIRSFTPAISDIYGLIPTDVGRPLERFVPFVDDMPPLPNPKELTLRGSIEHKVHANNGETYLRRVLPYRSHTGTSEGMVCTFTNVTDLTESEELFQLLIDASSQMVWVTNSEGKAVDDSPGWREFTGQTFDE